MTTASALSLRRTPIVALLAADGISRAGNAITVVAVPLIALQISNTPLAIAAAGIAATLPMVIGGAVGGVVVDRLGFRRASIIADAASGITVLAVPLLAAADALSLGALLTLVFLSNLLDAPGSAARASQIPELSAMAGMPLPRAAAVQATVARSATMVGAGAAGLLVALTGPAPTMLVDAATFGAAIALTLAFVPHVALPGGDRADAEQDRGLGWRALTAGMRFILRTPLAYAMIAMVVVTNAIDTAGLTVLQPLYAQSLGHGGAELGVMIACFSGGALAGAALYGIVGDRLPRHGLLIVLFLLAGPPPYLVLMFAPPFAVVAVVLALAGLAAGPLNPMIDAALYRLIPAGIRARVLGALTAGVTAAMPLGSFLAGAGVDALGLTAALGSAAALYLVTIVSSGFGRRWRGF